MVASLEVRTQLRLTQAEQEQLARAGLWGLAPVEGWSANGTNQDNAYATHGVFRYFGKFPPPVPAHLVERYTRPGELVFDPMCGSGTTGVECLLAGRPCELRDVNPLSLLLARVKTRRVGRGRLEAALRRIQERYRPRDHGFDPVGLRDPGHWFLPATVRSLRGLRAVIEQEQRPGVRDVFWAAFAATVRRVSRATTQQGRLFLDTGSAVPDAWPVFYKRALGTIRAVSALPAGRADTVRVDRHDLRRPIDGGCAGRARLAIVHPPYFNAYRYSRVNCLELAWLGCEHSSVREGEVREFFKVGEPKNLSRYLDDMQRALANAAALLAPGGALALMIGDAMLRERHLPVTRPLLDRLEGRGLDIELIALRVPRFSEATWVASQRRNGERVGVKLCDYVIVLRKEGP